MRQFKDCKGRTWDLSITVGSLERLKGSDLRLDLTALALENMQAVGELFRDGPRFVHAVYTLCRAEEKGCSQEEFADGFDGDTLAAAEAACQEELIGFFRQPEARQTMRKLFEKRAEIETKILGAARERMDRLDTDAMKEMAARKMDEAIEEGMASMQTALSGSSGD